MSAVRPRQGVGIRELKKSPSLRERVRRALDRYLAFPLALGSVLLILLTIVQLTSPLRADEGRLVATAIVVLWAIFLLHLFAQLLLAPDRIAYLRRHWLEVVASAVPFFSVLRIAMLVRFAPILRLLLFGGRHMSATMRILRRRHLGQLAIVTVFVVLIATLLEYLVESQAPGSNINSVTESLWWAASTVTTIGAQLYPVTEAGRILGFLLMLYAAGGFSYFIASIAAVLVGTDANRERRVTPSQEFVTVKLTREQLHALRALLQAAEGGGLQS
jgi:voltage-gated potassium channel